MKEIQLTQGKVALVAGEDFGKLNQYKWHITKKGYAARNIVLNNKNRTLRMHREIMNAPNGIQVDHRDRNKINNCKYNLWFATNQQNLFNREMQKNNKLRIKGVHWRTGVKKFHAQIKVGGKKVFLGLFHVMGDADSVYRIAEEKYFKEFARKVC